MTTNSTQDKTAAIAAEMRTAINAIKAANAIAGSRRVYVTIESRDGKHKYDIQKVNHVCYMGVHWQISRGAKATAKGAISVKDAAELAHVLAFGPDSLEVS